MYRYFSFSVKCMDGVCAKLIEMRVGQSRACLLIASSSRHAKFMHFAARGKRRLTTISILRNPFGSRRTLKLSVSGPNSYSHFTAIFPTVQNYFVTSEKIFIIRTIFNPLLERRAPNYCTAIYSNDYSKMGFEVHWRAPLQPKGFLKIVEFVRISNKTCVCVYVCLYVPLFNSTINFTLIHVIVCNIHKHFSCPDSSYYCLLSGGWVFSDHLH